MVSKTNFNQKSVNHKTRSRTSNHIMVHKIIIMVSKFNIRQKFVNHKTGSLTDIRYYGQKGNNYGLQNL